MISWLSHKLLEMSLISRKEEFNGMNSDITKSDNFKYAKLSSMILYEKVVIKFSAETSAVFVNFNKLLQINIWKCSAKAYFANFAFSCWWSLHFATLILSIFQRNQFILFNGIYKFESHTGKKETQEFLSENVMAGIL